MPAANIHGRRLTRAELDEVLATSGIDPARVRFWTELPEASFNTAYRIELAGGDRLVLKVAPAPDAPVLRYERGIMATEALFYRLAGGKLPVPRVVHVAAPNSTFGNGFLLMSECPGHNWYGQRDQIGDTDRDLLRGSLGRMVAGLHEITGPGFGYPHESVAPLSGSWRVAFLAMLDALLADATRFGANLPRPPAEIGELVHACAEVLDEVTVPVLVHFDLWEGNILVHRNGGPPTIGGLVDGERAFWGDPVAELVSLALFRDIEHDTAFLAGYRDAGGSLTWTASSRRRLSLYRTYLLLIILIEAMPRGYTGPDQDRAARFVTGHLVAELTKLGGGRHPWPTVGT